MSAEGFPGFQRLEFEAVTDVQPFVFFEGAQPTVSVSDLSSFIHAPASTEQPFAENCYFFQFGGFNNTRNRLARGGADLWDDTDTDFPIVPDQVHRIVVENDEGRLRFVVDGKLLMERFERSPAVGPGQDRFGLYFYTAAKVSNLRLYVKPLAPDDI